jgi:hypothetical protein
MAYPMTTQALTRIGIIWKREMKKRINEAGKVASGALIDSIDFKVVQTKTGPKIEIQYLDYLEYVNAGRKPRGSARPITAANGAVPIPALESWVKLKGLRGKNKKTGKPLPSLSLAFAIRASIWKRGIKPANIYDETLKSVADMINPFNIPPNTPEPLRQELQRIFIAMQEDVNVLVENMIDKIIPSKTIVRQK